MQEKKKVLLLAGGGTLGSYTALELLKKALQLPSQPSVGYVADAAEDVKHPKKNA